VKKKMIGVLGDLVSTDKKYNLAIEIALANAIHNVVTKTEQDAADLINVLKDNKLGRVTFLPIENIRARSLENSILRDAERQHGFIDVASNLVKNDKSLDDIVANILGKIIICEDMDSARTIAKAITYQAKIITLDGDSINAGGSMTGGSVRRDASGILGRAGEIKELESSLVKKDQELAVLEAKRQEVDTKVGDIERELAQLAEQLKYFSVERAKAESEYKNLGQRRTELNDSVAESEKQLHQISVDKLRLEDDIAEYSQIIKELENEISDYKENIDKNDAETREFNEKLDKIREKITEGKTASERILAERNGVLDLASHIKDELTQRKKSLEESKTSRNEDAATLQAILVGIEGKKAVKNEQGKSF
jgi:chromosome segregation protein